MMADGTETRMYRNIGSIVIGCDEDFTLAIELSTESLMVALEQLGYLVVPVEVG
jgi:hypothetical protein